KRSASAPRVPIGAGISSSPVPTCFRFLLVRVPIPLRDCVMFYLLGNRWWWWSDFGAAGGGGGGCDGFVMGVMVAAARSELEVMRGVVVRFLCIWLTSSASV
ncbi:hypothetical protein A2U01_0035660, partial [Trifolium medium]|nr:hypothetical protein [Trifolium medium]